SRAAADRGPSRHTPQPIAPRRRRPRPRRRRRSWEESVRSRASETDNASRTPGQAVLEQRMVRGMARALVIIDIQNDYFPGGKRGLVGSEAAAGRAHELLSAFRDSGEPVFHIQHVWDADDAPFFAPDTEGVQIYETLRPQGDERHIVKHHA